MRTICFFFFALDFVMNEFEYGDMAVRANVWSTRENVALFESETNEQKRQH